MLAASPDLAHALQKVTTIAQVTVLAPAAEDLGLGEGKDGARRGGRRPAEGGGGRALPKVTTIM